MKIAYSLYELPFIKSEWPPRRGALLKVQFDQNLIGYADCHPWPELGDASLEFQLDALKRQEKTPLTACSLASAYLDAKARYQKRSLVDGLGKPRSHYLITHLDQWTKEEAQRLIEQGFTHVKVKVGKQPGQEVKQLVHLFKDTPLQVRLDFNERLTEAAFRAFCKGIETLKSQVDFIEDPFPFEPALWAAVQKEGWTLACDRQMEKACLLPSSAAVLIVKPAIQSRREGKQRIVVTSYLGHPLEQVSAAYAAALLDPQGQEVHGLLSHHVYQPSCFSLCLVQQGPHFVFPAGMGWGFDDALSTLEWKPLC